MIDNFVIKSIIIHEIEPFTIFLSTNLSPKWMRLIWRRKPKRKFVAWHQGWKNCLPRTELEASTTTRRTAIPDVSWISPILMGWGSFTIRTVIMSLVPSSNRRVTLGLVQSPLNWPTNKASMPSLMSFSCLGGLRWAWFAGLTNNIVRHAHKNPKFQS